MNSCNICMGVKWNIHKLAELVLLINAIGLALFAALQSVVGVLALVLCITEFILRSEQIASVENTKVGKAVTLFTVLLHNALCLTVVFRLEGILVTCKVRIKITNLLLQHFQKFTQIIFETVCFIWFLQQMSCRFLIINSVKTTERVEGNGRVKFRYGNRPCRMYGKASSHVLFKRMRAFIFTVRLVYITKVI